MRKGKSVLFYFSSTIRRSLVRCSISVFILLPSLTTLAFAVIILPDGFQETVVFSGLNAPTAVRFSPDGRVVIAEKSGIIKVFA